MASSVTAVLLAFCVCLAFGASVHKQNGERQTIRDIERLDRGVKIVKRACRVSTFETEAVGKELQSVGNPVFLDTISNNRGIFLDSIVGLTFDEIMYDIYNHRSNKWTHQKTTVVTELQKKCTTSGISTTSTVGQFYISILNEYTLDCVYGKLNPVLRNFRTQPKSDFGSYALMLNVILTQWTSLAVFTGKTYRGVGDCFDIDPYTVNTVFTWTGFTSSSSEEAEACNFAKRALFIIDNSVDSEWRPISIEDYSNHPGEAEYLYPASALFKVTSVTDDACGKFYIKKIHISLQQGHKDISKPGVSGGTMIGGRGFAVAITIVAVVILV